MSKVFIFGLDGATLDLIRPWAEAGDLPTLRRLMEGGTWGPLETTVPPMTSPAWPSFATAKYPAKHGVFDFVSAHEGNFNVINATNVDARSLWDILSACGKRVGLMNVPVTYPPHPVNGYMITGLLSPTSGQITYPSDLLRRYRDAEDMPPYRVMPSIQYKPGNEAAFLRDLEEMIEVRVTFAERLMEDHEWDFMMVHFLATDLVQHALWRHMDPAHPRHEAGNPFQDAIRTIYCRVDAAMGRLMEQLDDDATVFVMSDHGFGPLHGVVNLNMLLWRKGLLRFKRTPLAMLRAFTFRHGLTPALAYRWLSRLNLQNVVSRVSKSTRNAVFNTFLSFDDIDWDRTVAYSLGHMGQIYVNRRALQERQNGRSSTYQQACEEVVEALQTLTAPDGHPLLDRVIHRSELPGGAHAMEGPDLHVVLDGYRYISCPLFANDASVISKQIRGDSGCHRMHGTFIAYGPHIRAGAQLEGARIVDLTPTVLYLMGCPIPDDVDGRVLDRALDASFVEQHVLHVRQDGSARTQPVYVLSDDEEAELEERLKGLGYLG